MQNALRVFDCSDQPGAAPVVLDDNPSVECSLEDKVWKTQLFLSAVVIVVFVLGFPAWIYYRITTARKDPSKFNDAEFRTRAVGATAASRSSSSSARSASARPS